MTSNQKFLETTTHNLAWVYKRYEADELELSAPFQRNPVWSTTQKSYLIDTILQGYPIPELYIQEFTDAEGEDRYVVVDGQQRLRACIEYMNNEFALEATAKQPIKNEGQFFRQLEPVEKRSIYNYKFVVRQLPDMSDKEIRSVFSRINRNTVALNEQELRHSTYWGAFIRTMETLAQDKRWKDIGIFSANDVRRMLDIEYISELAIAYLHGPQNKKASLDGYYATYENEFEQQSELIRIFRRALSLIIVTLPEISKTRYSKKSDFYTLFQLFTAERDKILDKTPRQVRESLVQFASLVNRFIAEPEAEPVPPGYVRTYVGAVERAASDLSNRKQRLSSLIEAIK
jgi:hypothetical protein